MTTPLMGALATPLSTSSLGSNPAAGHVEALISRGRLRPGDRLLPERELALHVGVRLNQLLEGEDPAPVAAADLAAPKARPAPSPSRPLKSIEVRRNRG